MAFLAPDILETSGVSKIKPLWVGPGFADFRAQIHYESPSLIRPLTVPNHTRLAVCQTGPQRA